MNQEKDIQSGLLYRREKRAVVDLKMATTHRTKWKKRNMGRKFSYKNGYQSGF